MDKKERKKKTVFKVRKFHPDRKGHPAHIVLVRNNNSAAALQDILDQVHGSDSAINAAIWLNPEKTGIERHLDDVNYWCDIYGIGFTGLRTSSRDGFNSLRTFFNKEAQRRRDVARAQKGLRPLLDHVLKRLEMFGTVFPGRDVRVSVSASPYAKLTTPGGNAHVDGGAEGEDRFIETLAGVPVGLINNKNVVFGTGFNRVRLKETHEAAVTLWQVPLHALTMLTSYGNSNKPIMHAPPPPPENELQPQRIVVTYDLMKKDAPRPFLPF